MKYCINFWGRDASNLFLETVPCQYTSTEDRHYTYFFNTTEQYQACKHNMQKKCKENNWVVGIDCIENEYADCLVSAEMDLVYKGERYPYKHRFSYGYSVDSAYYMFFEGNYACDCNLYDFLYATYGNEVGEYMEMECGENIVIENFKVVLEIFEEF